MHTEVTDCALPEFDDIKDGEIFECPCGRTWKYLEGLDSWAYVVPVAEQRDYHDGI